MKIVFLSNFLNHHQLPLALELNRLTDNGFVFIATTLVPQERLALGYYDMNKTYPFVIRAYENLQEEQKAKKIILDADVVIMGSAPEEFLQQRIEQNKLIFRYSERIYKRGYIYACSFKGRKTIKTFHVHPKEKPIYMLCASVFTAGDYALHGAYKDKCFKWGYFPEVKGYNLNNLLNLKKQHKQIKLLWVGRLISLKHPEMAIQLADKLKQKGYDFSLDIIGDGPLKDSLQQQIQKKDLTNNVHLLGVMPPEEVRKHMEQAKVFLFTSDYREGWGAVLNEAMNSACAVVASDAIGAAGFLIENGKNGLVFKNKNKYSLYQQVKKVLDNDVYREELGRNAYFTLKELWNPQVAATRLLQLIAALQKGQRTPFEEGPCSIAVRKYGGEIYTGPME